MSGTSTAPAATAFLAESVLRALDTARTGVTVITRDEAGKPVRRYANQAFADLVGFSLQEARTLLPMGRVAPEEVARLQPLFDGWLGGSPLSTVQTIFVRKNGERFPVELALAHTTFRGAPAGVVFARDVSDRVAIEQALRASEHRFRQLAEGAPDGITVHVRGRLVYANQYVMRMTGAQSFEKLAEAGILSFLAEDERPAMIDRLARVAAGEVIAPCIYQLSGSAASYVEVHSIAFEYDGLPAVLSFARDVSERQRMLEDLRRADRLAALGTLAAAVAHEVNNPLTYVLLHLGELRDMVASLPLGAATQDATNMIAEALEGAERIRVIVRDLLSFARSDPSAREAVSVEHAIESAIRLAGNVLRHRATIRREYHLVRAVAAIRSRIEQVFLNLLVNAAQAIPEDRSGPGEIKIRIAPADGDRVSVEVADNGPGISATDLPRVFEPFFTTKPEGIGTGLGLAISRTIVESLGGEITVYCPPGGGTTVRVTLPATDAPAAVPEVPTHRGPTTVRRGRLLVVDDEARLARLLATLVGDLHSVDVATSGQDALEQLQAGTDYDVVLCDLMMPDMTGMDLYEAICQDRPEMAQRFVFLTGGAFTERAARFVDQAHVTTILKPFDLSQIEAAIQERLS